MPLFDPGPNKAHNCNVVTRLAAHVVMAVLSVLVVFWVSAALSSSSLLSSNIMNEATEVSPITGMACRTWLFRVLPDSKQPERGSPANAGSSTPCGWSY